MAYLMTANKSAIAKKAGIGRRTLYDLLDPNKEFNPELSTISAVIRAIVLLCNGRASVTAEMALKLAAAFKTTPEFWLNAQKAVDLYKAIQHIKRLPKPLKAS